MTRFDKIDDSTRSASQLIDANSNTNVSEKLSKKAPLNIDFASQSLVISHSFSILSARNAHEFFI